MPLRLDRRHHDIDIIMPCTDRGEGRFDLHGGHLEKHGDFGHSWLFVVGHHYRDDRPRAAKHKVCAWAGH